MRGMGGGTESGPSLFILVETGMRTSRLEYRKRAFDYLAQAKETDDPEQRAEMLSLAKMWLYLSEPVDDMPGHYELPKYRPGPDNRRR
jgi:hypothetical protein